MTVARLSGRPGKMLARFPSFMRADDRGKVLAQTALALGRQVDEAERLMTNIQRAHRLAAADEERDVIQLAALLGLERGDFAILRELYDRGLFEVDDAELDAVIAKWRKSGEGKGLPKPEPARLAYDEYVGELKEMVARIARVMLDGCGTIWALLEGAAIMIVSDVVIPEGSSTGELLEHVDAGLPRGGFIHRVAVEYRTVGDGESPLTQSSIYLLENPVIDVYTDKTDRRQREWFRCERGGFWGGPVAIKVTGVAERTIKPMIVTTGTNEGVGYTGVMAEAAELIFATDGHAYLDGEDVTKRCFYFEGALFDNAVFDSEVTDDSFVEVQPPGALDRNFPRPEIQWLDELPVVTLPLGETDWRFSIEEGAFDASAFEEAAWALPSDPAALAALAASGAVEMGWRENKPFSAIVFIPPDLKELEPSLGGVDLRLLVRAGLERFRPAGIELDVEYSEDDWVMGESVVRDLEPESGGGLFFTTTSLGGNT